MHLAAFPLDSEGDDMAEDLEVNPVADRTSLREPPVLRSEHGESSLTRLIEQQTAKIPSDFFLAAALGAMAASLTFELTGRQRVSRFVGMWPGPLLVMGVYNKLVKVLGPR
jgi:hypothetical protein